MRYSLVASQLAHLIKYKLSKQRLIKGETKVSNQAIREYLLGILSFYKTLSKKKKSEVLSHAQNVSKLSRKQIIRRLNSGEEKLRKSKPPGAPRKYPREELLPHIKELNISMSNISAKRMKSALSDWLPYYSKCGENIRRLLFSMSVATLGRYLKEIRQSSTGFQKGLSATSPSRYMMNKVPINTLDSKVDKPGYAQADTVAHCGTTTAGQYVNTLTLTDILSTWTANRALFSKKAREVRKNFSDIKEHLPFKLIALNTDSGSEFLNTPFILFNSESKIHFTRSRPYKKNDNCYVEQKNYSHVRKLFGYQRIENPSLVDLMNDIYINYWNPLQNFFLPTFKLKEKIRVGAKIIKKYDRPMTPYKRLIYSPHLSEKEKQALRNMKSRLNPFKLKEGLENKLSLFFKLLNSIPSNERISYV